MWAVLREPGWGRYVRADEKLNFFRSRPAIPSGTLKAFVSRADAERKGRLGPTDVPRGGAVEAARAHGSSYRRLREHRRRARACPSSEARIASTIHSMGHVAIGEYLSRSCIGCSRVTQ